MLELTRYVVLNPIRTGMVKKPENWLWSSYRASVGLEPAAPWLEVDGLLAQFAVRRSLAQQRYAEFVAQGINADSPWSKLKGQVFLGDDQFVERMQTHLQSGKEDVQTPIAQRRPHRDHYRKLRDSHQTEMMPSLRLTRMAGTLTSKLQITLGCILRQQGELLGEVGDVLCINTRPDPVDFN